MSISSIGSFASNPYGNLPMARTPAKAAGKPEEAGGVPAELAARRKEENTLLDSLKKKLPDADTAAAVANATRDRFLQQTGTAVLAQANARPKDVLSLLS